MPIPCKHCPYCSTCTPNNPGAICAPNQSMKNHLVQTVSLQEHVRHKKAEATYKVGDGSREDIARMTIKTLHIYDVSRGQIMDQLIVRMGYGMDEADELCTKYIAEADEELGQLLGNNQ